MAIGRITGRMLKTPLERNSTDLVLSTDAHANTLKIDATNGRIGIRHSSPSHGLTVDGIGIDGNIIETIDSNADLELRASGSGAISISGIKFPNADGTLGQFLKTDGAGNLSFADLSLGDLSIVGSTIATPSNADLTLVPGGTGSVVINSVSIRDNIIQTNESNANLQLSGNGTGTVLINSLSFPTGTGTNGQVMVSDGSGNLSFTDVATTLQAVSDNGATTTNAVTVGGLTSTSDVTVTGTTFTDRIQSTGSNADIVLDPQGTGSVNIETGTQAGLTIGDLDGNYKSKSYVLWGTTTDATETEIFVAGNSGSRISIGSNTTVSYKVQLVARRTDATGESASWELKATADNFSGTTADVGSVYEVIVARDDTNWLVDARADDTNDSVNIYVTGAAGKTIAWMARVETVEVSQ
jgi:hypothetical protein